MPFLSLSQYTIAKITGLKKMAMYVESNIEARSCNHCCSGRAVSVTYCERVFVALGIQHAMRMRRICHLWPAPLYNIFPHFLKNCTIFGKKVTEQKMFVLIFSTNFVCNVSYSKNN